MKQFIYFLLLVLAGCSGEAQYGLNSLKEKIQQCQQTTSISSSCSRIHHDQQLVSSAVSKLSIHRQAFGLEILEKQWQLNQLNTAILALQKKNNSPSLEEKRKLLAKIKNHLGWYLAVVAYFESPA